MRNQGYKDTGAYFSLPYYRFDHTTERKHRASLDGELKLNEGVQEVKTWKSFDAI